MGTFIRLLLMEVENIWRFPTLEIVAATAIVLALGRPNPIIIGPESSRILFFGSAPNVSSTILFLIFIIPTLTARTFAKGLSSNEMRVLLSYPVRRWETLLAKIATVFVPTFVIFSIPFLFDAFYIHGISVLNTIPYSLLISLLLPCLFITALSFGLSLLIKDDLKSVLLSLFTLLFLELTSDRLGSPYNYMSITKGAILLKDYSLAFYLGRTTQFFKNQTIAEVQVASAFPMVTSVIFLAATFLYFQFRLDID